MEHQLRFLASGFRTDHLHVHAAAEGKPNRKPRSDYARGNPDLLTLAHEHAHEQSAQLVRVRGFGGLTTKLVEL